MESILKTAESALATLLNMPSILLFAVVLNIIGWALKKTPLDNRAIPLVLLVLAGVVGPWLLPRHPGVVAPNVSDPEISDYLRRILVSLIVGFGAWVFHHSFLTYIEKYVPGFSQKEEIAKQKIADADDK